MESLSNFLPILAAVKANGLRELLVLFLGPVPFDLGTYAIGVLRLLVLGRASLVEMWMLPLVSNQGRLGLSIS